MSDFKITVNKPDYLKGSSNYQQWAENIESSLRAMSCWKFVTGHKIRPQELIDDPKASPQTVYTDDEKNKREKDIEEWDEKDSKAIYVIVMQCDRSIQPHLGPHKKTSKELWEYLRGAYGPYGHATLRENFTNLINLRYESCKSIDDFNQKFNTYLSKMSQAVNGQHLSDDLLVTLYIELLDSSFDTWASRMRSEMRVRLPTLDFLQGDIQQEARRVENTDSGTALVVRTKTSNKKQDAKTSRSSSKDSKKKKCPHCNLGTHPKEDCWKLHPEKAPDDWKERKLEKDPQFFKTTDGQRGKAKTSNKTTNDEITNIRDSSTVLVANTPDVITIDPRITALMGTQDLRNEWVVDSGATEHLCNDLSMFIEHRHVPNRKVTQGKGTIRVVAVGTVAQNWIRPDGSIHAITLLNALYVPELFTNLLSCNQMRSKGYYFHTGKDIICRMDDDFAIGSVNYTGRLWTIKMAPKQPLTDSQRSYAAVHQSIALPTACHEDIWHSRLGHVGRTTLKATAKATTGLEISANTSPENVCETCALAKSHRHVNHQQIPRAKNPFDLVHVDVLGHITPMNPSGKRWILQLVDSTTRVRWAYAMKAKAEASQKLVEYVNFLEQHGHKVKCFRFDCGREFFKGIDDLKRKGISIEPTAPYTPEQNGVAERANGTLTTRIRSMMIAGKIPEMLWEDTMQAATHLLNNTSNATLAHKTPKGVFDQLTKGLDEYQPPDISHLRAYGCRVYVHIPSERRIRSEKFKSRAEIGKLIGYQGKTNYKVWIPNPNQPSQGRTVVTPHVAFDESIVDVSNDTLNDENYGEWEAMNTIEFSTTKNTPTDVIRRLEETVREANRPPTTQETGDTLVQWPTIEEGGDLDVGIAPPAPRRGPGRPRGTQGSRRSRGTRGGRSTNGPREERRATKDTQTLTPWSEGPDLQRWNQINTPAEQHTRALDQDSEAGGSTRFLEALQDDETPREEAEEESEEESYDPALRRSTRPIKPPARYDEQTFVSQIFTAFVAATQVGPRDYEEPLTYQEALNSPEASKWLKGMEEEVASLTKNKTWELAKLPKDRKLLRGKWIFKIKVDANGRPCRWKARWVVKGYMQIEGIDFRDTFASVVKSETFKLIFALITLHNWECEQVDIATAFLHGNLDEEIYMEQPTGFEEGDKDDVCLLQKTLYGLKQSPREWYKVLIQYLVDNGFRLLQSDVCVLVGLGNMIIMVYVDDIQIIAPTMDQVFQVKKMLSSKFETKDLGPAAYFLGIRIERNRQKRTLTLTQDATIQRVLKQFGMSQCKVVNTPMGKSTDMSPFTGSINEDRQKQYQSIVGSIMYVTTQTRPDIAYAVSALSRHCINPGEHHLLAAKRVLRYLAGTTNTGVTYKFTSNQDTLDLVAYSDSDWAGDSETRKSTSGYVILAGGGPIAWSSMHQRLVALSSCEAEYYGLGEVTKHVLWTQQLLQELGYSGPDRMPMEIRCDSTSAIALSKNPEFHRRIKHVSIRWHFIRQHQEQEDITINYVPTEDQAADGLTKALTTEKHRRFLQLLHMHPD